MTTIEFLVVACVAIPQVVVLGGSILVACSSCNNSSKNSEET